MLDTGPLKTLCRSSSFLPAVGSSNLECPQKQRMALIATCQVLGEPIQVRYSVFISATQKLESPVAEKGGVLVCLAVKLVLWKIL